ncbi:Dihydrolipoyllysine-residue(2-methylpropanoyl) transferase [Stackebrandtia nassauensis DSM 44728]|uniref:Dihydrolipoamide acetyltransferase component of pyruvate dehydrogenase complex n=2 Tax=Stackebrandtia TaxID=283810 RepID=D3PVL8_STANL|nr:Dihydrolipoyllysine-residue(2-methylpropanoyl) transferase [Stackebrandtia nassauensis DSM 44728]
MPSLGADMDAGTLTEWLVAPGDHVSKGDIVAVVETAKADMEVECFDAGVIGELLVHPGARVPVGTVLATIVTDDGGSPGEPAAAPAIEPAPPRADAPPEPPRVSPLVRHLARENHVDLAKVPATGPDGTVTRADLDRVLHRRRISPLARRLATELKVDLARIDADGPIHARHVREAATHRHPAERSTSAAREATARLMARSKREIPHYYLAATIDLGPAVDWLTDLNRRLPVSQRVLPAALLLVATARAAATVKDLNGHWIDDRFQAADRIRLGLAVSVRGGGLVVPGIDDAAALSVPEMMDRVRDLATRARTGQLRAGELADPSITVSNLGDTGVDSVLGVIYPPQVALVGFGAITERPWAVNGLLGVRPVVTASLSADHRVTDGAVGARFLNHIDRLLREPEEL